MEEKAMIAAKELINKISIVRYKEIPVRIESVEPQYCVCNIDGKLMQIPYQDLYPILLSDHELIEQIFGYAGDDVYENNGNWYLLGWCNIISVYLNCKDTIVIDSAQVSDSLHIFQKKYYNQEKKHLPIKLLIKPD